MVICRKCGSMKFIERSAGECSRDFYVNNKGEIQEEKWSMDEIKEDSEYNCKECGSDDIYELDKFRIKDIIKLKRTKIENRLDLLRKLLVIEEL